MRYLEARARNTANTYTFEAFERGGHRSGAYASGGCEAIDGVPAGNRTARSAGNVGVTTIYCNSLLDGVRNCTWRLDKGVAPLAPDVATVHHVFQIEGPTDMNKLVLHAVVI